MPQAKPKGREQGQPQSTDAESPANKREKEKIKLFGIDKESLREGRDKSAEQRRQKKKDALKSRLRGPPVVHPYLGPPGPPVNDETDTEEERESDDIDNFIAGLEKQIEGIADDNISI